MHEILHCKHCGNKTSHSILSEVEETEFVEVEEYGEIDFELTYLFTQCNNCNKFSLYVIVDKDLETAKTLYPYENELNQNVPKEIKNAFSEALKVKKISKYAFVILIRRSLELITKEQNAIGNNLATRILYLGNNGVLPKKITEMADLIRLLGNESVHESDIDINEFDLNILEDFFVAIVDYIYCINLKIERIKTKIKKNST